MTKKNPLKWNCQARDIVDWNIVSFHDLSKTPLNILKSLASANWPVRVLENNIFRPELGGILENVKINGSIKIFIKSIDPDLTSTKRSKHNVITLDETSNITVGLPIFE